MGLDMFFYTSPANVEEVSDENTNEIMYFRKHSDLHGWLEENYWNSDEQFNCKYLEITPEILENMKNLVEQEEKKHYEGFFWGKSTEEDWENTKKLIPMIQAEFDSGNKVYYYSWW